MEKQFLEMFAGCHVRGRSVVIKGSKSLKLSDLEKKGIADVYSIKKIANDGIGLTHLLDWTWLKNLMSEEDKKRMLKIYTWKDLLVDGAIVTVVLGIIFLIISIFL